MKGKSVAWLKREKDSLAKQARTIRAILVKENENLPFSEVTHKKRRLEQIAKELTDIEVQMEKQT